MVLKDREEKWEKFTSSKNKYQVDENAFRYSVRGYKVKVVKEGKEWVGYYLEQ